MPTEPDRRGFLAASASFLASLPFAGGLFVLVRSGLAPAYSDLAERLPLPLCRLKDVPGDDIRRVPVSFEMRVGPSVENFSTAVFVTRHPLTREVLALSGQCTHLGCPVQLRDVEKSGEAEAPLRCPCHGGKFSRTGEVLDGPPPRPLPRLPVRVPDDPDGMIELLAL